MKNRTHVIRVALWRFVRPALDFLLWQPVRICDAVVGAMHHRNIAPQLYRDKNAPLRRLHFRLVKIWSPFYRAKPNVDAEPRASGSAEAPGSARVGL